ncbi:MAG: hypothetical protein LWX01_03635, partial [Deltaproteobacteria bacterium]|nr:hypothetical protein [Deltaproteobacteria bacterium]
MITKDNSIEYHRGDMVEWYINDHRGLEQGFTLKARPSGRMDSGLLQLQMRTTGNLIPAVEKEGKGIVFLDAQGNKVLRYSGLYACDAAGKELVSSMEADQEGIRLIVEDHEAVYPITIDPFIETKKLIASDGADSDHFGYSVSISGDTAIVGAYYDDDNGYDSGSAYIFSRNHGGADNWGQVKKLLAGDRAADDGFGWSVSISGDTAIVGALGDDDNGNGSGSAYVFAASKPKLLTGLGTYTTNGGWMESFQTDYSHEGWHQVNWPGYNSANGETRIAIGDIDGDGNDEIIVGLGPVPGNSSIPGGWFEVLDDDFSHLAWGRVNWGAYNSANGETRPACGDVDNDGNDEIVVGLGTYTTNGGWMEVFDYAGGAVTHKDWVHVNWPTYNSANGETRPACGDVDGDGNDEIVVGLGTYTTNGGWMEIFD